jgi:hypothetical protein
MAKEQLTIKNVDIENKGNSSRDMTSVYYM